MKIFHSLALLASIFTLSTFAKADPLPNDFQFQVLDPPPSVPDNPLDGTPFTVTFVAGSLCPASVQAFAASLNDSLFGCYFAYNDTAYTFTSINLVFENTTGSDPNTNLNGQAPDCLSTGTGVLPAAFGANPVCTLSYPDSTPRGLSDLPTDGRVYDLYYSGGTGLAPGAALYLAEYGPDPSAFGTGVGTVTEAIPATPEPDSLLLLSTGALAVGLVFIRRRNRRLAF